MRAQLLFLIMTFFLILAFNQKETMARPSLVPEIILLESAGK
jgi:hypothetical protein